jgi:hypothetical protein
MVLMSEIFENINGAIPLFSHGEQHLEEFLEQYPFDRDGMTRRWEMFDRVSAQVMSILRKKYPTLGERNHSILCGLQMCILRDKIKWTEKTYECYLSIMRTAETPTRR